MFSSKSQTSPLARVAGGLVAGAMALGLTAPAGAHAPELPIVPGHPTGHVKHPAGNKWPPEPEGLIGVRNFSDPTDANRRGSDEDSHFSRVENLLRNQRQITWLASRKLTRLSVETVTKKPDNNATTSAEAAPGTSANAGVVTAGTSERRLNFFDRQGNQTVTVRESATGQTTVTTTPAATSQPEITAAETAEAVTLARQYFSRQGITRVPALKGFGILAYKPTGNGFYASRVIYVSFHYNSDSPPEYVALVDLSRQSVLSARKEVAQ